MERIYSLNANQLAKELKTHKKYRNKTQKEIKESIGGVNALRIELQRLEEKRNKRSTKKIQNTLPKKEIQNTNPFGLPEIQYEILLKLEYHDILQYCAANKTLCDNTLWQLLINRDYPQWSNKTNKNAKLLYEKIVDFFDKETTSIISRFIIYKTKYVNFQKVYNGIHDLLVNYLSLVNINIETEVKFAYAIFNVMTVYVDKDIPIKDIRNMFELSEDEINDMLFHTSIDKIYGMIRSLDEMIMTYNMSDLNVREY